MAELGIVRAEPPRIERVPEIGEPSSDAAGERALAWLLVALIVVTVIVVTLALLPGA